MTNKMKIIFKEPWTLQNSSIKMPVEEYLEILEEI